MKRNTLVLIILLITGFVHAQDDPYVCTTSFQEYVDLESPESVNGDEVWDEYSSYPVTLGFDITIFDQSYSSLDIKAGGITFSGDNIKYMTAFFTPFGGYLLRDRGTTVSESAIGYEISGEEGYYVIKVEWKNAGFIQWYPTSDPSDYVDFQIWIFQEDGHLEYHFGPSQADAGTYGYPDFQSDPDPGPAITFNFDTCLDLLCFINDADNPSYNFFDFCTPNQKFVDGTPSSGITYTITPNDNSTGLHNAVHVSFEVYPNPVKDVLKIGGIPDLDAIKLISITDLQGKTVFSSREFTVRGSTILIDISNLVTGVYFLRATGNNAILHKKIIKSRN